MCNVVSLSIYYIHDCHLKKKKELACNNLREADTVVNELLIKRPIYKYDSVNYKHYIDRERCDRYNASDDVAD